MPLMSHPQRVALGARVRSWALYAAALLALAASVVLAISLSSVLPAVGGLAAALVLYGLGHSAAHRAQRYAVGAASEAHVAEVLNALAARGWTVRHSVTWPGRGDVDHVVDAPGGTRFAIETKTSRYERHHLQRTRDAANHVAMRRSSCVPVICLVRRRGVTFASDGVEVVSADRLADRLRELAGGR